MRVVSLRWLSCSVVLLGCGLDATSSDESLVPGVAGAAGVSSQGGAGGSKAGGAGSAGAAGQAGHGGATAGHGGVSGQGGVAGQAGAAGKAGTSGTAGKAGAAGVGGSAGVGGGGQGGAGTAGSAGMTATCGDGTRNGAEVCDGGVPVGVTCASVLTNSKAAGSLSCQPDCQGFDTSKCSVCGNGTRELDETCDGPDLDARTCVTEKGEGSTGTLVCSDSCTLDSSGCKAPPTCGNTKLDPQELCDGSLFAAGKTCASVTGHDNAKGDLLCDACAIKSENCHWCGDGKKNDDEDCDGNDLPGAQCPDTYTGSKSCSDSCQVVDSCKAPSCSDGVTNNGEADQDCGGPNCATKCNDGKKCGGDGDCQNGYCNGSKQCATPACNDGAKNGQETDKDCGGPCKDQGKRCGTDQGCQGNDDCQSAVCKGGKCAEPSCADGTKNGSETDSDCGGNGCVSRCDDEQMCNGSGDCAGGTCTMGKCSPPENCDQKSDCGGAVSCYAQLCLSLNPPTPKPSACPAGWTMISGGCFRRFDDPTSWYGAYKACRHYGGNLASLTDGQLNPVGKDSSGGNVSGSKEVWVGFACLNTGKADCSNKALWKWIDSTSTSIANWGTEDASDPCGAIRERANTNKDIGVGSRACNQTKGYLCEISP